MTQEARVTWLPKGHEQRADLAVLTVGWNVRDLILKNLEALFESAGTITAEVIIIDNASSDGTVEAIRSKYPEVRVIANPTNAGFSRANGQGMIVMHARHCLLLNPDMRVEPDALQKTVEYLDTHPEVGVVGARLSSSEGVVIESVRRFPDIWSQLAIMLKLPHLFPGVIARYLFKGFDYDKEQAVDSVRGSYFAIPSRALEMLGGLDTRYFIWFEEVDYCKAATVAGFKVMFVPTIRAMDLVGRSFAQRQSYWKQKMFTRTMLQYFQKWHPWWQSALIMCLRPLALASAWMLDRVSPPKK